MKFFKNGKAVTIVRRENGLYLATLLFNASFDGGDISTIKNVSRTLSGAVEWANRQLGGAE